MARPEPGVLTRLPNLKLISSTGMGVDHILSLPDLPKDVPVARVVTAEMVAQVAEYVVLSVLRVERDSDRFDRLQREGKWERRLSGRPGGRLRIGILGWGVIGRDCARQLILLGFNVTAWARSERVEDDVPIFSGREGFRRVLSTSDILIGSLPKTPATENILDAEALDRLPQNAHVINVGRGEHLVDDALLAALDSGKLSGATLDVFRKEPLPPEHPFWSHPKIRITPHSAGMLTPEDFSICHFAQSATSTSRSVAGESNQCRRRLLIRVVRKKPIGKTQARGPILAAVFRGLNEIHCFGCPSADLI